jgi:hypothetical protein
LVRHRRAGAARPRTPRRWRSPSARGVASGESLSDRRSVRWRSPRSAGTRKRSATTSNRPAVRNAVPSLRCAGATRCLRSVASTRRSGGCRTRRDATHGGARDTRESAARVAAQRKPAEALRALRDRAASRRPRSRGLRSWAQALDALGRGKEAEEKRALAEAVRPAREPGRRRPRFLALRR